MESWPARAAATSGSGLDVGSPGLLAGPGLARKAGVSGAGRRDDRQASTQAPSCQWPDSRPVLPGRHSPYYHRTFDALM